MSVIKSIGLFILILALLLALPLLLPSDGAPPSIESTQGLPWQIERLEGGRTRVFGLVPGNSTLDEARRVLAAQPEVALIMAENDQGAGALEAYIESLTIGPLAGKMILTLESTQTQREAMLGRAKKAEYMKSTTKRITLADEDLAAAAQKRIVAVAFIPGAQLDEAIVLQRFGAPGERIRSGEHTEHFLYPDKGLDIQLDAKGKELLQYVAPADFSRLREPLLAAAAAPQAQ